jgi:hypothetical protein
MTYPWEVRYPNGTTSQHGSHESAEDAALASVMSLPWVEVWQLRDGEWRLFERIPNSDPQPPLIGYLVDGKVWHPSDVTIIRQCESTGTNRKD